MSHHGFALGATDGTAAVGAGGDVRPAPAHREQQRGVRTVRFNRLFAVEFFLVGIVGLGIASASQLSVNTRSVSAGEHDVVSCNAGGFTVSYAIGWDAATAAHAITTVTVNDVDGSCIGSTLNLALLDEAGAVVFDSTALIGGPAVSFTSVDVPVNDASDVAVAVT